MTAYEIAYRAGCIVFEVEDRFTEEGLATNLLNHCAILPARLPIILRHIWPKAIKNKVIRDLLEDFHPEERALLPIEQSGFWFGYCCQKIARELPDTVGGKVKSLRESAEMSVEELSSKTELTRAAIYKLEGNETRPTWDTIQKIAKVFGVSTELFRD